jgi:HSP20 family protein
MTQEQAPTQTAGDGRSATKVSHTTYRPPVDLYELDDRYEIHADLPGSDADSIELTVQDGELDLRADVQSRYGEHLTPIHQEYGIGAYRRRIRLGEDIDLERLDASYRDGVLTISLPKVEHQQPRRIPVRPA